MPAPDAPMSARQDPGFLQLVAEDPQSLQEGLDRAVEQIRAAAAPGDRRGILITRRSRSLFTVQASAEAPYGTTLEKDRWHRPAVKSPLGAGDEAGS